MSDGVGVVLIVAGAGLGIGVSFTAWPRWPAALGLTVVTIAGLLVAAGALVVQDRVGAADWAVTTLVLGVLTPMHAWILFGRPGQRA
jgi:hypothetical protein